MANIHKNGQVLYNGIKGTFAAIVKEIGDNYARIEISSASRPQNKDKIVDKIVNVNPQSLTLITNQNRKRLLKLIPQVDSVRPLLFQDNDDVLYLSKIFNVSVKSVYTCIANMMENNQKYYNTEYVDSRDLAKILALENRNQRITNFKAPIPEPMLDILPEDAINEILLRLPPGDISNFCFSSKRVLKLCNEISFRKNYEAAWPTELTFNNYMINWGFPHAYLADVYIAEHRIEFKYKFARKMVNLYTATGKYESREDNNSIKPVIDITFIYYPDVVINIIINPNGNKIVVHHSIENVPSSTFKEKGSKFEIDNVKVVKVLKIIGIYTFLKGQSVEKIIDMFVAYDFMIKETIGADKVITNLKAVANTQPTIGYFIHDHRADKPWEHDIKPVDETK